MGIVELPGDGMGVAVSGDYAYVGNFNEGLLVVNMADVRNPVVVGSVAIPGLAGGVGVQGTVACATGEIWDSTSYVGMLNVVDVSDPPQPLLRGMLTGACCHPDARCTLTLHAECQPPSSWQGAGTTCTTNPCVPTPIILESWASSSLVTGLQIRWEVPLGTTGALYRAWRDPAAGPNDVAPTPEAVLVSSVWTSASAEGIVETLDREAPRGTAVRYFLEGIVQRPHGPARRKRPLPGTNGILRE